jgi:cell division protein FtsL
MARKWLWQALQTRMSQCSSPNAHRQVRILPLAIAVCVVLCAVALVLPNHGPPWMFFLQETIVAAALAGLALVVLVTARGNFVWRVPEMLVLGLTLLVAVQFAAGRILLVQTALMSALYLIGLFLALQVGAELDKRKSGTVAQLVLLPALLAGLGSVGLQTYQWLAMGPDSDLTWIFRPAGARPAANLGQPNLLATIQVIGMLGLYSLWRDRRLSAALAFALVVVLCCGVAMTQSRTALLNIWLIVSGLLAWNWRQLSLCRSLVGIGLIATSLFVGYMLFGATLGSAAGDGLSHRGASVGTRPFAWGLFAAAIYEQPLSGFGWGQGFLALLAVSPRFETIPELWLQTHNLLLDLAVWSGLPIALLVVGAGAAWLVQCVSRSQDDASRVLVLVIAVVAVHAMLEYPLHYSFILLPTGLAAGALGHRIQATVAWRAPRWVTLLLLATALATLLAVVRDYLRVEHSYRQLLLEKARIQMLDDRLPPEVLVLTSLRDLIVFSRLEPVVGMTKGELEWMARVVKTHPGAHGFAKLARALALNDQVDQAERWVQDLCRIFPDRQCQELAHEWAAWTESEPLLSSVRWP